MRLCILEHTKLYQVHDELIRLTQCILMYTKNNTVVLVVDKKPKQMGLAVNQIYQNHWQSLTLTYDV